MVNPLFTGIVTHSHLSLSFQGVKLREHNFSWRFVATDKSESDIIDTIIRQFKMAMLPTKTEWEDLSKIGETAIDICAYATHIAALLGAHIIKVKPPTQALENLEAIKESFEVSFKQIEEAKLKSLHDQWQDNYSALDLKIKNLF